MRTPAVTVALLIILALGFGTAAMADNGSSAGAPGHTKSTGSTNATPQAGGDKTTTDATDPAGADGAPTTATQTDGTTSPGASDAPALEPAAAPVLGTSAAVTPVSGEVRVKLPGSGAYVSLGDAASVPMGATVDATHGTVRLTSAHNASGTPQSADFHDGAFILAGQTKGANPITDLKLSGGDFTAACGKAALSLAKRPPVRQLWGSGHGRFRTHGRYSAATVRGTIWLTRDTCDGTLTIVKRGVVAVRDAVLQKTVMVHAGSSYFARAPLPVGAATALTGF